LDSRIRKNLGFDDIDKLIARYNSQLYKTHQGRRLEKYGENIYIKDYEDDSKFIIEKLNEISASGIANYSNSVLSWLGTSGYPIDCPEKKEALTQMFERSRVALIYGSAGTGKSTLINHIANFFNDRKKMFLANTHPAVENLKRKVNAANCEFATIAKFVGGNITLECDVLFIDECSTVSNKDMRGVLEKATFKLLVLVGDTYQIESIIFGNWFSLAKDCIVPLSVFELEKPYRTDDAKLLELWSRVRKVDDTITEHIAKNKFSTKFDETIFARSDGDEIILCLNYDGLYGINNLNRFLQESNPNKTIQWGVKTYKKGDPILFNESERFAPVIYNNTKGGIADIKIDADIIWFDIEIDKAINELDAEWQDFVLVGNSEKGNSIIRFPVRKYKSTDNDDDGAVNNIVPFQIAYAVSIHKAQGLEYNSVKVVITDEIDELITHNIFYTAITRAKAKLKIYWEAETEHKILDSFAKKIDSNKDFNILSSRYDLRHKGGTGA
jgi:ATP-dependent exoDNAse (exonuclease V) alpha subunit